LIALLSRLPFHSGKYRALFITRPFTIYEPDTLLPSFLIDEFIQAQNEFVGSPSAQFEFKSLILEERIKVNRE
jgi:hypothetical protein